MIFSVCVDPPGCADQLMVDFVFDFKLAMVAQIRCIHNDGIVAGPVFFDADNVVDFAARQTNEMCTG